MFPLHAVNKPARRPVVTLTLIALNVLVFVYQWAVGLLDSGHSLAGLWGVRPACYISPGSCGIGLPGGAEYLWKPLFFSMFLHAGLLHLGFNMLFLWVFGAGVEDKLGKWRFALAYLGCGLAANGAYILTHLLSPIPVIGASGAIAGILGLYLVLMPRSWILTYIPPIFVLPVPAVLFLALWAGLQVVGVLAHLPFLGSAGQGSEIAWTSHVGGFIAGALMGWMIAPWWRRNEARVASR